MSTMTMVTPARTLRTANVPAPRSAHTQVSAAAQSGIRAGAAHDSVRLTRRGRLAVSIASIVLAAFAGAAVVTMATGTDVSASSTAVTYTVQPGDTLWGIAARVHPGADRRDTVATLLRLNPSAAGGVSAGQVLREPR